MKFKFIPLLSLLLFAEIFAFVNTANAQDAVKLTEGFDTIPSGWVITNNSDPIGTSSWEQGVVNPGGKITFPSYNGAPNSYIAASFTSVLNKGTISTWLITPTLVIQNGATVSFWTRTVLNSKYPDRIEVRLNKTDSSANVGTDAFSVGSFTDSLLSVNPTLAAGGYPDSAWKQYKITLSGITGIDTGRIAIRYFVTNAGLLSSNGNYIGVDDFEYDAGALPVDFLSFNGILKNNFATLTWSTANEVNNKGFNVEKSYDGQSFLDIGFVAPSTSPSNGRNDYSYSDPKLLSGNNYYRIKQIDLDGNYKYSSTIKLEFNKFGWTILGNGTSNSSLQLQLDKPHNVAIQIVSLSGSVIQTINKGNIGQGTYSIPLNFKASSHGMYVVKMMIDGQVSSKNFFR